MLSDKFLFSFAINIFHLHSNSVISGAGDILTSEYIIESFQVMSVVPTVASCVPMVRIIRYVRCYDARAEEADCSCLVTSVLSAGVVMSGYKEQCHANYVWVDWRQKCLRRN